jgi:hypothetical protein
MFPALSADSWISTPDITAHFGPDLPGDGASSIWFDTTNNGPQTNFEFARLTLPQNATGTFNFEMNIADGAAVFSQSFSLALPTAVPAPATLSLLGLALLRRARRRRAGTR